MSATSMAHQDDAGQPMPVCSSITPINDFDTTTSEAVPQELPATASHPVTPMAPTNPQASLQELLENHEELRIWLDHTGFFDHGHRKRVLDGVRELQGLEAEKAKVLQKIQSSKPSDKLASASSPSACSTPTQQKLHVRDAAAYGTLSPPREPSAHARSCSASRAPPLVRELEQLSVRMAARKDTRYFLVKSSNTTNVYMSRRDGLWITQAKNGPLFTEAFREAKSVILFFSINKSKAFQGYARMSSAPDPAIRLPLWIASTANDMHTTAPFRIDWVNESETSFSQLGDLKNPYNEFNPVFVGRDGQEYPDDCGRRMMDVMDRVKTVQGLHASSSVPARGHPGRQRARAEMKRSFATIAGPSSSESQPRAVGLEASRWKPRASSPGFLSLNREPVDHDDGDLLLEYP
ncbi:hypothetical protein ED733_006367 [Metarhizium rileyi]|uniref:YTH domain-containing protein n=1 Tax=Metarhizium rileyi (strain RCEF 4871) TaxID=1649241 RepID=A0A5C6GDI5_METRR|nr:hypothetical protein ED733_006367 [Metarhizium rileyi]